MFGFDKAIQLLKEGKKVKRAHWGGYWVIQDFELNTKYYDSGTMIVAYLKDDKGVAPASAYQEDLLAEDWSEVE